MKDYNWERFVETGKIVDYINYTSCTSEDINNIDSSFFKENAGDNINERTNGTYRNGIRSYANW